MHLQYEAILNSVADGICSLDSKGRVTFANPAATQMLGRSESALLGRFLHEAVYAGALDGAPLHPDLILTEPLTGTDLFQNASGTSFAVDFSCTPIVDDGEFAGGVLVFRDTSERTAAAKLKDEFVATVSHELRTPLTSIHGALGLLASGTLGPLSGKAAHLLQIAVANSDRLIRLLNDILDLERMDSGRAPLTLQMCNVNEIAAQVAESMQPAAAAARISVQVECEAIQLAADPDRIGQVFSNLLSNAIKFSPEGGTVIVRAKHNGIAAEIDVVDSGRGIPEEKRSQIFDRFQQVEPGDSRLNHGTGLGLAICRGIIEQHGGRIWVVRNPDSGSTFRFTLPLKNPALLHHAASTTNRTGLGSANDIQ